jgi:CBS domain containing-hemolysin-like protein
VIQILVLFGLLLLLMGAFSGSETAVYSISRVRLDADARAGHPTARMLRALVANDAALLVTLVVGHNLAVELATHLADDALDLLGGVPRGTREILVAACITPFFFFFGDLLPKDAFRRRPHRFLYALTPLISAARILFLPLSLPLVGLGVLLERLLGVRERDFTRALGREEVLEILREGTREGLLAPHAEEIARNVLVLRETPLERVMLPWSRVSRLDLDLACAEQRAQVESSEYTRMPALRQEPGGGRRVVGYVHQLDVLSDPGREPREALREVSFLSPDLTLDRAVSRLSQSGQRMAVVGSSAEPRGLVTLLDLLASVSDSWGRLARPLRQTPQPSGHVVRNPVPPLG